jgi:hypothetical protein
MRHRRGVLTRLVVTLPLAALAVHQLRCAVVGEPVESRVHSYLPFALAVALALVASGLFALLAGALRARRSHGRHDTLPSVTVLWAWASVALAAIYIVQEALEVGVPPWDPRAIAGLIVGGGWLAVPLGVALGFVVAVFVHGAQAVVATIARKRVVRRDRRGPAQRPRHRPAHRARRAPLATRLAGRAPPLRA